MVVMLRLLVAPVASLRVVLVDLLDLIPYIFV